MGSHSSFLLVLFIVLIQSFFVNCGDDPEVIKFLQEEALKLTDSHFDETDPILYRVATKEFDNFHSDSEGKGPAYFSRKKEAVAPKVIVLTAVDDRLRTFKSHDIYVVLIQKDDKSYYACYAYLRDLTLDQDKDYSTEIKGTKHVIEWEAWNPRGAKQYKAENLFGWTSCEESIFTPCKKSEPSEPKNEKYELLVDQNAEDEIDKRVIVILEDNPGLMMTTNFAFDLENSPQEVSLLKAINTIAQDVKAGDSEDRLTNWQEQIKKIGHLKYDCLKMTLEEDPDLSTLVGMAVMKELYNGVDFKMDGKDFWENMDNIAYTAKHKQVIHVRASSTGGGKNGGCKASGRGEEPKQHWVAYNTKEFYTEVDLFSEIGWRTYKLTVQKLQSLKREKTPFLGFGNCQTFGMKLDNSDPVIANMKLHLQRLRKDCDERMVARIKKLIEEGYIESDETDFKLNAGKFAELMTKEKLTATERGYITTALEFVSFIKAYEKETTKLEPNDATGVAIPRRIATLIRVVFEHLTAIKQLIPRHFISLTRRIILTLKTCLIKQLQDIQTVKSKNCGGCNAEIQIRGGMNLLGLIGYVVKNLREHGKDVHFQKYFKENEKDLEKKITAYY